MLLTADSPYTRKIDWSRLYKDGLLRQIVNPISGDVYTINAFLGSGTYGYVFRASSLQLGHDVAMKIFNITDDNDADFKAELESYIYLSHTPSCQKHIVCLYDSFVIPDSRSIVPTIPLSIHKQSIGIGIYELMDGDLDHQGISDDEVPFLFVDLLDGLDFIHKNGFAHRDIKPANLLVKHSTPGDSDEGVVFKLGDLGLTCSETLQDQCSYIGTILYSSPESLQHWKQEASLEDTQRMDIWMLGVSLYQIVFLQYPFPADQTYLTNLTQEQVNAVVNERIPYPRQENSLLSSYEIIFILSRMLKVDPTKRATASELLDYIHTISRVKAELFATPERMSEEKALSEELPEEEIPLSEFPAVPIESPRLQSPSFRRVPGEQMIPLSPCDPLLSQLNARQLIREIEKAILDRIRNNISHYETHIENIRAIRASQCIDEAYLDTIYRIYHDDVLVRSSLGKPDNLIFLGDLALSHLDEDSTNSSLDVDRQSLGFSSSDLR